VTYFCSNYSVQPKVHLNVVQAIPAHIGLGSGTQFSLAIAAALSQVLNVKASVPELSVVMGRVRRTSVGTSIFLKGGFVVDAAKTSKPTPIPHSYIANPSLLIGASSSSSPTSKKAYQAQKKPRHSTKCLLCQRMALHISAD
jgi:beta-RFAP synthase